MKIFHTLGLTGRVVHDPEKHALAGIGNSALSIASAQICYGNQVFVSGFSDPEQTGKNKWNGIQISTVKRWDWAKVNERYDASLLLPLFFQVVNKMPIDVLHVHELGLLYLPTNKIRVMHLHVPMGENMGYSHLWARADGVICVSEFVRNVFLAKSNFPSEQTFVVYNGSDLNLISTELVKQKRYELGLSKDDIMLLFVGALNSLKGPHILLNSLEFLKINSPRIFSKIRTFFVGGSKLWRARGDESKADQYEQNLLERELNLNAKFLGMMPHKEVEVLYKACDIAIFPSIIPESHPLVVCEALAAGKPIIASKVGGIPETVEEGKNAFLIPPGDHVKLAKYIIQLVNNSTLRKMMSDASLKRSEQFTWKRAAETLNQIYLSLIDQKKNRGK